MKDLIRRRVLVADDEESMLDLLSYHLNEEGYEVNPARNGSEALEKAQASPPDAIVVDLIMPEINGFSLCELFRLNPATARTPIIMISGWDHGVARQISSESGANAYVTKPFSPRELIELLQRFLKTSDQE